MRGLLAESAWAIGKLASMQSLSLMAEQTMSGDRSSRGVCAGMLTRTPRPRCWNGPSIRVSRNSKHSRSLARTRLAPKPHSQLRKLGENQWKLIRIGKPLPISAAQYVAFLQGLLCMLMPEIHFGLFDVDDEPHWWVIGILFADYGIIGPHRDRGIDLRQDTISLAIGVMVIAYLLYWH